LRGDALQQIRIIGAGRRHRIAGRTHQLQLHSRLPERQIGACGDDQDAGNGGNRGAQRRRDSFQPDMQHIALRGGCGRRVRQWGGAARFDAGQGRQIHAQERIRADILRVLRDGGQQLRMLRKIAVLQK
jgi:hypothetical protein